MCHFYLGDPVANNDSINLKVDLCCCRFCIGHGLPEAHGCGEAAKKAARQQLARDGQLYPGSGKRHAFKNIRPVHIFKDILAIFTFVKICFFREIKSSCPH